MGGGGQHWTPKRTISGYRYSGRDLGSIGFGGNHIIQNTIAKLVANANSNNSSKTALQYSYEDYGVITAAIFVDPPAYHFVIWYRALCFLSLTRYQST